MTRLQKVGAVAHVLCVAASAVAIAIGVSGW